MSELTINIIVSTFIFIYLHLVLLENPDDILSYWVVSEILLACLPPILEEIIQFDLHIETTK